MKPLLIFGTGLQAEQADFWFSRIGGRRVDAFAVDPAHLRGDRFAGRPVLAFDEAVRRFPPATHDLFVAIGHTATEARRRKFLAGRELGYAMPSFVHPSAAIEQGVVVGANTMVHPQVTVAPFVSLGEDLILEAHSTISHHVRLGSHGFVAPGAVICGDVQIGECCFIGAHATIRDRVTVGAGCIIGMGAVITADCAPRGVYRALPTARTRELPPEAEP